MEILTDRMPRLGGSSRLSLAGQPPSAHVPGCRYRLLEEIANGGMGVVHRAVDTLFEREVALKLIHDKHAGNEGIRLRFHEEARITARLQHPGIPPVHDQGVLPDGRLFLAMKWIQGRTLAALLEEDDPPAGRKLAIFEGVCQAVGYAHSKGIIHRDLKPSNIMVGAFGETQVMDWGLGKVMVGEMAIEAPTATPDAETQAGSAIGTFAYMPPEQAKGDRDSIGPASDVFGLGAVLCHLLTGEAPYRGSAAEPTSGLAAGGKLDDALNRIAACDAEEDLKAICRKCLAVDPQERYADAGNLARTVGLLRQSTEERARRAEVAAARGRERRKLWIGLSAMLLLGTSVAGWLAVRERNARRDEAAQKDVAEAERDRAFTARNRARAVLDAMTSPVIETNLLTQQSLTPEQERFFQKVMRHYEELASGDASDPAGRSEVAAALYRLGMIEFKLGNHEKSVANMEAGIDHLQALLAETPEDGELRRRHALALHKKGHALSKLGRLAEARKAFEEAMGGLESLPARDADSDADRKLSASLRESLAALTEATGRVEAAEGQLLQAAESREALAKERPEDIVRRAEAAKGIAQRADMLRMSKRYAEAESEFRKAIATLEEIYRMNPRQPAIRNDLATSLGGLGQTLARTGRHKEAVELHLRSVDLFAGLVAEHPLAPHARAKWANEKSFLGVELIVTGRKKEGEATCREGMQLQEKLAAEFPKQPEYRVGLGGSYCNFGNLLLVDRRYDEALEWFGKAIALLEPEHRAFPESAVAKRYLRIGQSSLAKALDLMGRPSEAAHAYDAAVKLSEDQERTKFEGLRDACRAKAGK